MKTFYFLLAVIVLVGCATTSPVVYTASGNMEVIGYGEESRTSRNAAIKKAQKQCRVSKQSVQIVTESTVYQGRVDEELNRMAKTARDVAWGAGESKAAWALGGVSSKEDYVTTLEFSCR